MHTGDKNASLLGTISTWNRRTRSDAYPGHCGLVSGSSDGLLPPGFTSTSATFSIFSTDLCRPLHFDLAYSSQVHNIPVQVFKLDDKNFANGTVCESNRCYNNNLPSGVQNVTQCKMESPVYVSKPHFLSADPFYQSMFQSGIRPQPEKHESSFWIEERTSIPMKVEMKLQLNVYIRKVQGIDYVFKNLDDLMFPVFWFNTTALLPKEKSGGLHLLVILPTLMDVGSTLEN